MDHLIRFTTAEGVEGTHHATGLDDAVAFAERVRNAEGATDVRLYRLVEVPIEFRPYYRVEVQGGETRDVPAAAATPVAPEAAGPPPIPVDGGPRLVPHTPADAGAATNGRRLFTR